jgi:hypothetical protein
VKVAFHFNASHPAFGSYYGPKVEALLFTKLMDRRTLHLSSKVYVGDLPWFVLTQNGDEIMQTAVAWFSHARNVWHRFTDRIQLIAQRESYVVCFESMGKVLAESLHGQLSSEDGYLGAVEVDDTNRLHWDSYSDALRLQYRVTDEKVAVFYDEVLGDVPDAGERGEETKRLSALGFGAVGFEPCTGRHSFFDKYHNYKHARRVAEWKNKYADLLGFMVDDVICRLGDTTPELANKLWAALSTFEGAETDEQYAQVSVTCRRVIDYVADALFPPTSEIRNGKKLGPGNYRNRLLAYVGEQVASSTSLEVIASSMELFAKHVEALENLTHKGVHSDVQREGARRCLLRTVLLLDDIISLRRENFPVKADLDFSILGVATGGDESGEKDDIGIDEA